MQPLSIPSANSVWSSMPPGPSGQPQITSSTSSAPARNTIVVQRAVISTKNENQKILNNNSVSSKNAPKLDVTRQVTDLFLNEQKTELYIPKEFYAKTLLMLHHFRNERTLGSKPLEFLNNKHLRNMREVTLQMVIVYADAKLSITVHGTESLYIHTVENPNHGCKLEFRYASLMTPPKQSTSMAPRQSSSMGSKSVGKKDTSHMFHNRDHNNISVSVNDSILSTMVDGCSSSLNGIVYHSVLPALQNKVYETCVRDTLIQRATINNRDEISDYFSRFDETTKLKLKYRVNSLTQRVEVLSLDETLTVIALCDLGVGKAHQKDQVVQLANNYLRTHPPAPHPSNDDVEEQQPKQLSYQSSLITIQNAVYLLGEEYRNITDQLNDMLCYDRLIVPSRDKGFYFDMFFVDQNSRGEEPRLELQYSLYNGAKVFSEFVHEREGLLIMTPASVVTNEERLQCLNAGRFTPHILNDSAENTRKKMVNNALYLRETQSKNIAFKIKSSLGKMSEALQSYQYVLLRYGSMKLIWIGEHNDGVKAISHVNNSSLSSQVSRPEQYLSHGRTMSEDAYGKPPTNEQLLNDTTEPLLLSQSTTTAQELNRYQSAPELRSSNTIASQSEEPVSRVSLPSRSVEEANSRWKRSIRQEYLVADEYVNLLSESESVVQEAPQTSSSHPLPPLPDLPPRSTHTTSNTETDNISTTSYHNGSGREAESRREDISISSFNPSELNLPSRPNSSSTPTSVISEDVPPVLSVVEAPASSTGVKIESRFMQAMDSISIQVYDTRFSVADVLVRSDVYALLIVGLWVVFVISDPALYRWLGVVYVLSRLSIDLTFSIIKDTVLAATMFLIVYLIKNPETLSVWIDKMRAGQLEMEKVQVARETMLGKMFDLYVWLVKKTKRRRPVEPSDTEIKKKQEISAPSIVTVEKIQSDA